MGRIFKLEFQSGTAEKAERKSSGMTKISITPEWLEMLRRRLRSGDEAPSPTVPVYQDISEPALRVRTSSRSITLIAQLYDPIPKQVRYLTLDRVDVLSGAKITAKWLAGVRDKLSVQRKELEAITEADAEDEAELTENAAKPLSELFEIYKSLPDFQKLKCKDDIAATIERHFLNYPIKRQTLGTMKASQFGKVAAQRWLDSLEGGSSPTLAARLKGKGSPAVARQVRQYVSRMLNVLVRKSYLSRNPVAETEQIEPRPARTGKLTPAQLKDFWQATGKLPDTQKHFARLVVLTAQRERQLAHMKWDWIDWDAHEINFPSEIMKGKRDRTPPYDLPMSAPVVEILKAQKQAQIGARDNAQRESPYIFATSSGAPIANLGKLAARIDALIKDEPFDWTSKRNAAPAFFWLWHDFRRTALAIVEAANHDVTPLHLKLLIAHKIVKSGDALGNYSDVKMAHMKRELFDLLGNEVLRIVGEAPPIKTCGDSFDEELAALCARHGRTIDF